MYSVVLDDIKVRLHGHSFPSARDVVHYLTHIKKPTAKWTTLKKHLVDKNPAFEQVCMKKVKARGGQLDVLTERGGHELYDYLVEHESHLLHGNHGDRWDRLYAVTWRQRPQKKRKQSLETEMSLEDLVYFFVTGMSFTQWVRHGESLTQQQKKDIDEMCGLARFAQDMTSAFEMLLVYKQHKTGA